MIRIILIDNDEQYRKRLLEFLNDNGFIVFGSFHDPNFISDNLPNPPDIAIIAYKGIKTINLNAAAWLKEKYPFVKVIMSALPEENISSFEFKQSGVDGLYYKKDRDFDIILRAIDKILAGKYFFPGTLKRDKSLMAAVKEYHKFSKHWRVE